MTLAGRVAVVTGVTSPLGEAVAARLMKEGAAVAVTGRTAGKLEAVVKTLQAAGGRSMAEALDLSSFETAEAFFTRVAQELGPVEILVNGTAWRIRESFLETTPEHWR